MRAREHKHVLHSASDSSWKYDLGNGKLVRDHLQSMHGQGLSDDVLCQVHVPPHSMRCSSTQCASVLHMARYHSKPGVLGYHAMHAHPAYPRTTNLRHPRLPSVPAVGVLPGVQ